MRYFESVRSKKGKRSQFNSSKTTTKGTPPMLDVQYISGKKNASKARMALILDTIHIVGQELAAV